MPKKPEITGTKYTTLIAKIKTSLQEDIETYFRIGLLVTEARDLGASWEQLQRDTKIKWMYLNRYAKVYLYWGKDRIPKCTMIAHYAQIACHVNVDKMPEVAQAKARLLLEGDEIWEEINSWLASCAYRFREAQMRERESDPAYKASQNKHREERRLQALESWALGHYQAYPPSVKTGDAREVELLKQGLAALLDRLASQGVTPNDVRRYRQRPARVA